MDLTEAENIKKSWKEYTEVYKENLHDPDNNGSVNTHLKPDILECEVKWALGSMTMNKNSGGDEIPAELFKILKYDAVSAALNMQAILENTVETTELEKISFHSSPKEGQCQRLFKLPHDCTHFTY